MGELLKVDVFPLSGARGVDLSETAVLPTGIPGDRQYVGYDPYAFEDPSEYDSHEDVHRRVSQRQHPRLAQVTARYGDGGELLLSHDRAGEVAVPHDGVDSDQRAIYIGEFGDRTPAHDVGDEASTFLNLVTGANMSEAIRITRLARKTPEWMNETDWSAILGRNVRPVHIVSEAEVTALQQLGAARGISGFDATRFRPNLLVRDFGPFTAAELLGLTLRIGELSIFITDVTRRCPLPGYDQVTGENRKDVPQLYPQLPRAVAKPQKPSFGVYGVPMLNKHDPAPVIKVGNRVEIRK